MEARDIYQKFGVLYSMKNLFLKLVSYIFPIRGARIGIKANTQLELRWENGKLVLNTDKANYSFGSLHRIWRKALKEVSIKDTNRILVLGGGGWQY